MKQWQLRKPVLSLTFVLLLGVLVACGGSTEPAAPAEPPTAVAPAEVPTVPPVESEPITETEIGEPEVVTATEAVTEPASSEITATASMSENAALTESAAASETSGGGAQTFVIDPAQSQARFLIDEVLRGNPVTVEGITSLVSGELSVDPANPAASTIGTITVDANALETPESMRNRAIRNFILQTGSYQTITFTPTSIEGLPEGVAAGDSFSFTVSGDLQIRDVVNPATFVVEVTADSATQISGLATSSIARADYGLTIPDVPFVADVGEEVSLELEFVAVAQ